jgi:predicted nucleotidyltransferase component of viral defense system
MSKPVTNKVASVMDRLRSIAKQRNQPFDLLLTRYVLERLLYRLSTTPYRERFVLKGAVLMTTWFESPFRPTRDLDLLGFGDNAPDALLAIFREICAIVEDDGIEFDVDVVAVERIREELEYGDLRLQTIARLAKTRVKVSIDIAFGDATEPGLQEIDLPVLLGLPPPHLRAYAMETVIAEKFQAMVMLGRAIFQPNSVSYRCLSALHPLQRSAEIVFALGAPSQDRPRKTGAQSRPAGCGRLPGNRWCPRSTDRENAYDASAEA